MKKWIITFIVALFVIIAGSVLIFLKAKDPYQNAQQYAEERAISEANIESMDQYYLYNGSETYFVIVGENNNREKKVVWIPEDEDKEIIIKDWSSGISKGEALDLFLNETTPKKILGIRLGMEQNLPIWEVSYLDIESKLNYYYIHFETGKWWRKIENL